jgi:hypothetical protein
MFVARLICSDVDCAEEQEMRAGSVAELERLLCDCGCALEVIAWPDWVEDDAQVVALHRPSLRPPVRAAA